MLPDVAEGSATPFLPPRWFIRVAWAAHRAIYRWTGGRRGLGPPTATTYGTLRLHTIGRRTGKPRVAILGYFEDGPNLFTLAMNGWGEPEPAWWLNLQAEPDVTIDLRDGSGRYRGREAVGEERARLWAAMAKVETKLDAYATRRPRGTSVVVFEPLSASAPVGDAAER
jgi:deazaflavin-dependent oxidoreductase (nitroreductase family)